VALERLDVRLARGRRAGRIVREQRADEAAAEIAEREALAVLVLALADDEVDERVIRVPAVDRERGDARAGDDREREEPLADDVAERLERADALADALEPTIGPYGLERERLRVSLGGRLGLTGSHAVGRLSPPRARAGAPDARERPRR
jgi:hypothetical protein